MATTLPVLAWTTVIELSPKFGTQMLAPSNTGYADAIRRLRLEDRARGIEFNRLLAAGVGDPDVRTVIENAAGSWNPAVTVVTG